MYLGLLNKYNWVLNYQGLLNKKYNWVLDQKLRELNLFDDDRWWNEEKIWNSSYETQAELYFDQDGLLFSFLFVTCSLLSP